MHEVSSKEETQEGKIVEIKKMLEQKWGMVSKVG